MVKSFSQPAIHIKSNMIVIVLQLLGFALALVIIIPYLAFKAYTRSLPQSVFVFPYFPFIGTFFKEFQEAQTDYHRFMQKIIKKVKGKSLLVTNLFFKKVIIVVGNQYIKQFYLKSKDYVMVESTIKNMSQRIFGKALANQDGPFHSTRRKILAELFNFQFLNSKVSEIYKIIKYNFHAQQQVDVARLMMNVSSQVVVQCFLGTNFSGRQVQGKDIIQVGASLLQAEVQILQDPSYLLFGKIPGNILETSQAYRATIKQIVNDNYERDTKKQNFVSKLKDSLGLSREQQVQQISNQFSVFLAAGSDTTAHLLTSCIFFLLKFPIYQLKISQEVKNFSSQKLTANSGKEFSLLNCFIKEVQRLHGPAQGIFPRQVTADLFLKDVFIPKGSIIMVRTDFNYLSDQYFAEPFQFRPERWLQSTIGHQYVFLPFSAGHKNCIGQQLAMLEVRLTLMHLLKQGKVESVGELQKLRVKQLGLLSLDGVLRARFGM